MAQKSKTAHTDDGWRLVYEAYDPEKEKLREALCTVGNGYFGTRGAFEGAKSGEHHYPGTYFAGVYNKLPSEVHGKTIYNDDFVNCPNWLPLEIRFGDEPLRNLLELRIRSYRQELDMRNAVLTRELTVEDDRGRITTVVSRRIASMADQHTAGIECSITPVNYSERITVRSGLDGTVVNDGVARYRGLSNKHLGPVAETATNKIISLTTETSQSHVRIAYCATASVYDGDREVPVERSVATDLGWIAEDLSFDAQQGTTYRVEKLVSMFTSRDENMASPEDSAFAKINLLTTFDDLYHAHLTEWQQLWAVSDIVVEGDAFTQKVVRLHTYHLMATASPHNVHLDAGIPARGLHGEAYRGHIFWDDLFILPYYFRRFPKVARSALMYRYRRLDAARNYARAHGYRGAMYPWQTSNDGREETQVIHYNPVSGKWDPDLSCRQRHVSISVFYNVWEFYSCTNDIGFLCRYGAEMLIEIARFWASIATHDPAQDKYHIRGVMGPDEFHEKYEGAEEGGLNDNAYTNVMVVWLLLRAAQVVKLLPERVLERLSTRIRFDPDEISLWRDITRKMYVPVTDDGLVSQFDGYMGLEELDWEHYKRKYGNIHRMDRILKSEGDSPDKYKVAKQADALMLFYVLSPEEVMRILRGLGHKLPSRDEFLKRNYEYYVGRTSHGSTLSKIVHAAISRDMGMDRDHMWEWFMQALESDVNDTQGGTTPEGIHTGVMAGTINIITRVIAGVHIGETNLDITPNLPDHWTRLTFKLLLRGSLHVFNVTKERVTVTIDADGESPLTIGLGRD